MVAPERDSTRINERIRVPEIRVIGADGEQLGVMTPDDALAQAREAGLDLVEVAANSRPPVCRIMDYGRYKYEQKKKKSKTGKGHAATLKEVKLRPGTDMHDLEFKLNNARKFLMEGDKVKVTVMFRGREMVHTQRGRDQLMQVRSLLEPLAKMENAPRMEGRFMSMILVGDREAIAEAKRHEEAEAKAAGEEVAEATDDAAAEQNDDAIEESAANTIEETGSAAEPEKEDAPANEAER